MIGVIGDTMRSIQTTLASPTAAVDTTDITIPVTTMLAVVVVTVVERDMRAGMVVVVVVVVVVVTVVEGGMRAGMVVVVVVAAMSPMTGRSLPLPRTTEGVTPATSTMNMIATARPITTDGETEGEGETGGGRKAEEAGVEGAGSTAHPSAVGVMGFPGEPAWLV